MITQVVSKITWTDAAKELPQLTGTYLVAIKLHREGEPSIRTYFAVFRTQESQWTHSNDGWDMRMAPWLGTVIYWAPFPTELEFETVT